MVKYTHISEIETENSLMQELDNKKRSVCMDEIPMLYKSAVEMFLIGKTVSVIGGKDYMSYHDYHAFYLKINGATK